MTDRSTFTALGAHKYVRLTTFRKDGTPVPTPVWLVPDGDDLLVFTEASTGKVKRIRHTPRVLLAPSDGRGRVKQGTPDVEAVAEIVSERAEVSRISELLRARYGLAYRLAMLVQKVRGRSPDSGIGLRLSAAPEG